MTNRTRWLTLGLLIVALVALSSSAFASAPVLLRHAPARGEELAVEGAILLVFDRAMDRPSVESAFALDPSVPGDFEWIDERTVRFLPEIDWPRDTTFAISLSPDARDLSGIPLGVEEAFTVRTVGYLEVTQRVPAANAADIAVDTSIMVVFNRPVVALTAVSDPGFDLPAPLRISPHVEGAGAWMNTSIYLFTPSQPLIGGTEYSVAVEGGLVDTTGGLLAEDAVWTFTTQRPRMVWLDPDRDEDLVPIDATIRVSFNMLIDLESAKDRLTVRASGLLGDWLSPSVNGTVSVDGATLAFAPDRPLAYDRSYVVSLDPGITSPGGGLGSEEGARWSFRTVPLPAIVGTSPENGDRDVYPYTSFVITFNAPIVEGTVMDHVTIQPTPDPADLHTYYRSWDQSYVISFGAQPSSEYRVHIEPGIEDRYGNKTQETLSIGFRTADLSPAAWLHVPGQVGTVSSYEPAKLFVAHRNTERLSLSLTHLTLDQYFEAISDWYRFDPPQSGLIRTWDVSVDTRLNETLYTPIDLVEGGVSIEPGIYLVDMRADGTGWSRWQNRHLLIVSPVNLTLKTADEETLVWVTDLETGEPVPGLILWAHDNDGDVIDLGITDSRGTASLVGRDDVDWRGLTIAARSPFAVGSTDWDDGISVWEFGFSSEQPGAWRTHIETDRPIYRPGQTLYFQGTVRNEDDVHYTLPELAEVQVTVRDAAWNTILDQTLPVDEVGVFSGEIALEDDAALGTYRIEARVAGTRESVSVQVAEYRAPEFEVEVTPERDEIARGETLDTEIQATYFFGSPVADVPVEWRVLSETYAFTTAQFARYSFRDTDDPWDCWGCWWWSSSSSASPILEGSGRTDAEGRLLIELPDDLANLPLDDDEPRRDSRRLTIEASVRGNDGQTISGRASIIVHQGSHYVGLASSTAIGRAGEPMTVDVITVDWLGERAPARDVEYVIYRREWVNAFEENELGGGRWTWTTVDTETHRGQLVTDTSAEGDIVFTPPQGGSYRIVATSFDEAGRRIRASRFVWVSDSETVSWRRSENDRLTLISDKASYRPGETAEILVPSPFAGEQWALVTVERGGILSREVVLLSSNSTVLRVPITEDHVPNIYVGVVLVQGRADALAAGDGAPATSGTRIGYVALEVERDSRLLDIELTPSNGAPLPGETIDIDVRVRNADGEPVVGRFAVDLVDKAVLSLQPRVTGAIVEAFYARRGLGVSTSSGLTLSLSQLVLEQLEDAGIDLDEVKYAVSDATAGTALPMSAAPVMEEAARDGAPAGAGEQLPEGVDLREDFADTAYWNAEVSTDEDGTARISVPLPDNLTTWVVRAVGVTPSTLVGERTTDLLVTKPLLIRPVTPRFLVVGDRVRLSAQLSNLTKAALDAEVTVGQTGLSLDSPATQTVAVAAGGEVEAVWWAEVLDVDSVDLAFSVVSENLSDAARPRLTSDDGTIPVYRYTAPETVGTSGVLGEAGSRTELIALPDNASLDRTSLSLRIDPSLAAALEDGLGYLEHFDYECTEQVVSRFLPNVLTLRALKRLGINDASLTERLDRLVPEGLAKLYERQNSDGGWGWWSGLSSSPNLTAYVVFGLLHVAESGFTVRSQTIEDGLDFLESALRSPNLISTGWEANRQAWLVYVLSLGHRDHAVERQAAELFDERAKLAHYARAYLALSIDAIDPGSPLIATLVADLYGEAILSATGAHWEEEAYDGWAMNTDTRSTAIIIDALVALDPDNPIVANAVRWLMIARRNGIWETTQETAWALIALCDWMVMTGELEGAYDYGVSLDGAPLIEGTLTPESIRTSIERTVPGDSLSSLSSLSLYRGEGPGRMYYTAHLNVHLPVEDVGRLDRGLIVYRQYVPIDTPLDEFGEAVDSAPVGQSFEVRLTLIAPHDLYYVVLEDPIPAGCEAVDTSLATSSLLDEAPGLYRESDSDWPWFSWWWWRWYSRSELRDEKVVLFAETLPAGTYTYRYTLRATQQGEFRVLPASAYEFYFPEVFGRTDGDLFTVTAP